MVTTWTLQTVTIDGLTASDSRNMNLQTAAEGLVDGGVPPHFALLLVSTAKHLEGFILYIRLGLIRE